MLRIYIILGSGVLIASFSSILIRWTGDVPFSIIAFYRLFISSLTLFLFIGVRKQTLPRFKPSYLLAGFFLALHFISWIASLQLTTLANSVFLESTHPVWAVLISIIFLREFPSLKSVPAFVIAIIGMFFIVWTDIDSNSSQLFGDLLAILSAVSLSLYLLIARMYRNIRDIIGYLFCVYLSAAAICALYAVLTGQPFWGFSGFSWLMMFLLALGPHLIGHSLLNWASRHIEIFKVNLVLLLEPVLVSIAAVFLFQEIPTSGFYAGASLIVLSIGYLLYNERNL